MEKFIDDPEEFEEKDKPSEDIGELHFQRIQSFPLLTDAEELDLLQRWCEFRDKRTGDRIVRAHMRMVPPIARQAALKAGFEPNYNMLPTADRATAATGFAEVVSDLTAAGNLGLVQALGGYRLGKNVKFYSYARKCVRREIWKQATFLRSVVGKKGRKDGVTVKFDQSIDPLLPEIHDTRDYCGSRALCKLPTRSPDDKSTDWGMTGASHSRLRPQVKEPIKLNLDHLRKDELQIITGRARGLKLAELAKELNVSVASVWRKEKTAIARIRAHHERTADSRST